jgi:hypothetical protein
MESHFLAPFQRRWFFPVFGLVVYQRMDVPIFGRRTASAPPSSSHMPWFIRKSLSTLWSSVLPNKVKIYLNMNMNKMKIGSNKEYE